MKKRRAVPGRVSEPMAEYAPASGTDEVPVRKNHYLYQSKIDRAKQILGVATETEALNTALDMLIYAEALAQGTETMAGAEYNDVLGLADEVPMRDEEA